MPGCIDPRKSHAQRAMPMKARGGMCFAPLEARTWRHSMSWIFFALVVIAGFALLKVRRRRKSRHVGSYYDSKAA